MYSWMKATASDVTNCVELAAVGDGTGDTLVRDSKHPAGPVLRFTREEIRAWIAGARAGEFDHLT